MTMLLEKNNSKKTHFHVWRQFRRGTCPMEHHMKHYAKSLFSILASISCSLEFRNSNWNKPMRWCNMHPRGPRFFLWWVGWGGEGQGGIFCFSFVPNVFPSSSQRVPPQVPNSNTILSHMLCSKLSSFYLDRLAKGKAFHLWKNRNFYFEEAFK